MAANADFKYVLLDKALKVKRSASLMEKFYVSRKVDRGQRSSPNPPRRPEGQPPPTIGYPQPISVPHPLNIPGSLANRSFNECAPKEFVQNGVRAQNLGNQSFTEAVTPHDYREQNQIPQMQYSPGRYHRMPHSGSMSAIYPQPASKRDLSANFLSAGGIEKTFAEPTIPKKQEVPPSNDLNRSISETSKNVDYTKATGESNKKLARSNMYSSMPSLIEESKFENQRGGTDVVDSGKPRSASGSKMKSSLDVGHGPLMQKIMILCDGLKFGECSVFINRLSHETLNSILPELPIQTLLNAIPQSLGTLHTIYSKMLPQAGATCAEKSNPEQVDMVRKVLRLDETLRLIVKFFACQEDPLAQVERSESVTFHCKGVLKIIAQNKPQLKQKLYKKKKALERCLLGLGHHGPLPTPDGKLSSLHEALKLEFTRTVHQYKNALQKLDDGNANTLQRATSRSSVTSLSEQGSHQRMLQCNQIDVENRLIKNKTLFNAVEPVIMNQFLNKLIQTLEERITCDKAILFHYTELRKQSKDVPQTSQVAPFFHRYSTAYSRVLEIIQDVTQDDSNLDEVSDSDLETLETWSGSSIRSYRERNASSAGSFSKGYMQLDPEARSRNSFNGATPFGDGPGKDLGFCSENFPGFNVLEEPDEVAQLTAKVEELRKELNHAKETIAKLEERERLLKERMTSEAQKGIQSGTRFEDLNLGENRPTQLVRRYQNLYSQLRVDTMDALDSLEEVSSFDDLKGKLLFSVVVLAFRSVQESVGELKSKLHTLLQLPLPGGVSTQDGSIGTDMERSIIIYLKKTADKFDLTTNITEVSNQLWETLYDYPSLKSCQQLHVYIEEAVRLAWAMNVQNPPLVIDYDAMLFKPEMHSRFYMSDSDSVMVKSMIWPALCEGENGPCLSKGVVLT